MNIDPTKQGRQADKVVGPRFEGKRHQQDLTEQVQGRARNNHLIGHQEIADDTEA